MYEIPQCPTSKKRTEKWGKASKRQCLILTYVNLYKKLAHVYKYYLFSSKRGECAPEIDNRSLMMHEVLKMRLKVHILQKDLLNLTYRKLNFFSCF